MTTLTLKTVGVKAGLFMTHIGAFDGCFRSLLLHFCAQTPNSIAVGQLSVKPISEIK